MPLIVAGGVAVITVIREWPNGWLNGSIKFAAIYLCMYLTYILLDKVVEKRANRKNGG